MILGMGGVSLGCIITSMKHAVMPFLALVAVFALGFLYSREPSCVEPPKTIFIMSPRPACVVWEEIRSAHAKAGELMARYDQIMGQPYEPQPLGDEPMAFFEQKDVFVIDGISVVGVFKPSEITKVSTVLWAAPLENQYNALQHEMGHYVWWRRYGKYPYGENLWGYIAHGVPSDPYISALNSLVDVFINIGNSDHPYHPGYLPSKPLQASYFSKGTCYMPFSGKPNTESHDGL